MRVKVAFMLDIDAEAYWEQFGDRLRQMDPDDPRRRDAIVRDSVRGMAAAAAVQYFANKGVLRGYFVREWADEGVTYMVQEYEGVDR